MSNRRRGGTGDGLSFFSLIIIIVLGAALATSLTLGIIHASVRTAGTEWLMHVAFWTERIAVAFALVIPIMFSYREARARGTAMFIVWIISVIIIAVVYLLFGTIVMPRGYWISCS